MNGIGQTADSPQKDMFPTEREVTSKVQGQPLFSLTIPGKLPSWNEVLGMEHWTRKDLKKSIQAGFLSALRASAETSSTRTISARNIMLTAAVTLESSLKILQEQSELRRLNAKPTQGKRRR